MRNILLTFFAVLTVSFPHTVCGQSVRDGSNNIIETTFYSDLDPFENKNFSYRNEGRRKLEEQRARQSIRLGLMSVTALNIVNGVLADKYDWNLWVDVPAVIVASGVAMVPFFLWHKQYKNSDTSYMSSQPDSTTALLLEKKLKDCASRYGTSSVEYGRMLMICSAGCLLGYDLYTSSKLLKEGISIVREHGNGPFDGLDTIDEIFRHDMMILIENGSGRDYYALHHCIRTTELKRQYFGAESKFYLKSLLDMSELQAQRFHYSQSLKTHNEGYQAYVKLIKDEFCQRGEKGRSTYWQTAKNYIYATVDLAAQTASSWSTGQNRPLAGPTYNALLLSKGLLLNTTVGFENHVKNSGVEDAIELLEHRKQLSASNVPDSVLDSIDLVILRYLREDGVPYSIPSLNITWNDVQDALGDDDLAIEFFRDRSNEYGAVLLRKDWSAPRIVMLDDRVKIDSVYYSLDEALKLPMQIGAAYDANDLWKLSRAVWTDEIVKFFPRTIEGRVYFSTDGELQVNGVENLPMLPIKSSAIKDSVSFARSNYHTVSDLYHVHRLSSTRELVLKRQDGNGGKAAVFGGLNYDEDFRKGSPPKKKNKGWNSVMNGRGRGNFPFLNGTGPEATVVSDLLLKGMPHNFEVYTFIGDEGTEETFKALSGSNYDIIHVATHGFVKETAPPEFLAVTDTNNPLSVCGLALSWANDRMGGGEAIRGTDDGVLTSLEISTMDLRSTDLVVLSACETGLGSIGEDGVFGLQRGFKMAGVGTILMSLWKVDDDATQFLMTEFYRNWLDGMSKHDALEEAKRQVRSKQEWEDPMYWAAFILLDAVE